MNTRKNNDTPICAVNGYLTPCSSDIRPYVYSTVDAAAETAVSK